MTLATRLLLAFGFVAVLATTAIGLSMRDAARTLVTADFDDRIDAAARGVTEELSWEVAALGRLLVPLCESDTFVDRAQVDLDRAGGDPAGMTAGSRIALRHQVAGQARALGLDRLALVTGDGFILGSEDLGRIGTRDAALGALLRAPAGSPDVRREEPTGDVVIVAHCARVGPGAPLGLVGARRVQPILERVGAAYGVGLSPLAPRAAVPEDARSVVRVLELPGTPTVRIAATVSRARLEAALRQLDVAAAASGGVSLAVALALASLLARSLSRPIAALARETGEAMSGEPRPVEPRGGPELRELSEAFNRAVAQLAGMRKRLAVSERISARREIARRVAHEIKNPLAPIRAAVETLRRLRAREDPAFDEYFDEATRTVLEEVHRIANIVTQFTQFARMPPPHPEPVDLVAVARGVVTLHASSADATGPRDRPRVELTVEAIPEVVADRDQLVQVLTNLVQNGLDAASAVRPDPRVVVALGPGGPGKVRIVVRDNGPGVPEEMRARLFEPYATTKEKGTGLGLAIVQRIVFEHGGEIAYRPATKGGAVFELTLPVSGPPLLDRPTVEQTGSRESD